MVQLPARAGFLNALASFACVAMLVTGTTPVSARADLSSPSFTDLEAVYWRCDYATMQGLLDIATAEVCSKATEALRLTRFNGDFELMLAWWQQNKAAAHDALKSQAATVRSERTLEEEIDQMNDAGLLGFYLDCAQASQQRRLASDEIRACSVGQQALLTRVFAGRFEEMLAWLGSQLALSGEIAQRKE